MHGSSNCLGCCNKPPLITLVDDPSKGLKTQGKQVNNPSISEGVWTTRMGDMDNRGSISSISTTNQILNANCVTGSINTPEFVNHSLILWNQTRQRWVGNKKFENRPQEVQEPKLNWNTTYDSLLGSKKPFPRPIPLSEMVDFQVDAWGSRRQCTVEKLKQLKFCRLAVCLKALTVLRGRGRAKRRVYLNCSIIYLTRPLCFVFLFMHSLCRTALVSHHD